jgi:hypothetical protein
MELFDLQASPGLSVGKKNSPLRFKSVLPNGAVEQDLEDLIITYPSLLNWSELSLPADSLRKKTCKLQLTSSLYTMLTIADSFHVSAHIGEQYSGKDVIPHPGSNHGVAHLSDLQMECVLQASSSYGIILAQVVCFADSQAEPRRPSVLVRETLFEWGSSVELGVPSAVVHCERTSEV